MRTYHKLWDVASGILWESGISVLCLMTVPQDVFLSRKLRQVAESFLPKLSAELSSKDDVSYKALFCHTQHKFLLLIHEGPWRSMVGYRKGWCTWQDTLKIPAVGKNSPCKSPWQLCSPRAALREKANQSAGTSIASKYQLCKIWHIIHHDPPTVLYIYISICLMYSLYIIYYDIKCTTGTLKQAPLFS